MHFFLLRQYTFARGGQKLKNQDTLCKCLDQNQKLNIGLVEYSLSGRFQFGPLLGDNAGV